MKKILLTNLLLALFIFAKAYDFPLSDFGVLWQHTEVEIEHNQDHVLVTYNPKAPWMTQAGWEFDTPKDFSAYTHLLIELETVSISSGNYEINVESTLEEGKVSKQFSPISNSVVIDLSGMTEAQLESIKRVSIWVWDADTETAVFKVKNATLVSEDSLLPLFALQPLHGNTALEVNYTYGDEAAEVTYLPAEAWESQSGWEFKNNNADFSQYSSLVIDIDAIDVKGEFELHVESSVDSGSGQELTKRFDNDAEQLVIDLTDFTQEQLAAIERVSIWIWDTNTETSTFKVLSASLTSGESTIIKNISSDNVNVNVDVYSLTGVKVKSNVKKSEATKGLSRGIYIVGNEKIFVK